MNILSSDTTVTEHCATAKIVVEFTFDRFKEIKTFTGWSKVHPKDKRKGMFFEDTGEAIAFGRALEQAALFFKHTLAGMEFPDSYSPEAVTLDYDLPEVRAFTKEGMTTDEFMDYLDNITSAV